MVVVHTGHKPDVEADPRLKCEALEKMLDHFGRQVADPIALKRKVDCRIATTSYVDRNQRECLVELGTIACAIRTIPARSPSAWFRA